MINYTTVNLFYIQYKDLWDMQTHVNENLSVHHIILKAAENLTENNDIFLDS